MLRIYMRYLSDIYAMKTLYLWAFDLCLRLIINFNNEICL